MKEKDQIADYFKKNLEGFEAETGGLDWSQMQQSLSSGSAGTSIGSKFSIVSSSITTKILTVVIASMTVGGAFFANNYFNNLKETENETQIKREIPFEENEKNATQPIKEQKEEVINQNTPVEASEEDSDPSNLLQESATPDINTTSTETVVPTLELESKKQENESSSNQLSDEELEQIIQENESQFAKEENAKSSNDIQTVSESNRTEKSPKTSSVSDVSNFESDRNSTEEVEVIIPNVFTPNQDGINDVFVIEDEGLESLEVKIIDKTGNLIHEWNTLYGFWDGNLPNGEIAPQGMYFYQISGRKNGQKFIKKDMISLKR